MKRIHNKIARGSRLFLMEGIAVFWGGIIDTDLHQHYAIQITIGIEKAFHIEIDGDRIETRCILLNSECRHKLSGEDSSQLLVLIEPHSLYGEGLRDFMGRNQYFSTALEARTIEPVKRMLQMGETGQELLSKVFSMLNVSIEQPRIMDCRVLQALKMIQESAVEKFKVASISGAVFLSESRLQHLFRQQVGISMKRFLLWRRMISGIQLIIEGRNFTSASHEAGFSDSAHMSRAFKKMFGISLRDIFQNSRSVQAMQSDT